VSYSEPLSSTTPRQVDARMRRASPGLSAACCRGVWG
jgi:hypothetical protein